MADVQQSDEGNRKPAQPILVQLVGGDDLGPFEKQTLAIARESLAISRKAYWITAVGFLAAMAAAIFVYSQVRIMSYQTQIMGSQSESAAAGAAIGELNTRKQLSIAQQQAKAAQDSVEAIQPSVIRCEFSCLSGRSVQIDLEISECAISPAS